MRKVLDIIAIIIVANALLFYFIRLFYVLFQPKFMLVPRMRTFTNMKPTRGQLIFYYLAVIMLLINTIYSILDRIK
jgi:cytochrome b561